MQTVDTPSPSIRNTIQLTLDVEEAEFVSWAMALAVALINRERGPFKVAVDRVQRCSHNQTDKLNDMIDRFSKLVGAGFSNVMFFESSGLKGGLDEGTEPLLSKEINSLVCKLIGHCRCPDPVCCVCGELKL